MRGNDERAEETRREDELRLRGGNTRVEGVRGAGEVGGVGGGGGVDRLSNLLHFLLLFFINLLF